MTELRLVQQWGVQQRIVEVWEDGLFIAAIYPKDRGVKIVSKYLQGRLGDVVALDLVAPPALHVRIWPGPDPVVCHGPNVDAEPPEQSERAAIDDAFHAWLRQVAPETMKVWRETYEREERKR